MSRDELDFLDRLDVLDRPGMRRASPAIRPVLYPALDALVHSPGPVSISMLCAQLRAEQVHVDPSHAPVQTRAVAVAVRMLLHRGWAIRHAGGHPRCYSATQSGRQIILAGEGSLALEASPPGEIRPG